VRLDVAVGSNQKTGSACGRILNFFQCLRFDAADDAVDERARGEVLPGTGFGFAGIFFQQAFVEVTEAVSLRAEPVDGVEAFDQLFQVTWFAEPGLGVGVDGGDEWVATFGQVQQHLPVGVEQIEAGLVAQVGPTAAFGEFVVKLHFCLRLFVFHLDEQQQHQLGDIVGVVDAVITQHVAEVPEFLDDLGVTHGVLSFDQQLE